MSNLFLDFPVFGQSVLVGPRSKVVLRGKGYAWAPVLESFDNSKSEEFSPTQFIFVLPALWAPACIIFVCFA